MALIAVVLDRYLDAIATQASRKAHHRDNPHRLLALPLQVLPAFLSHQGSGFVPLLVAMLNASHQEQDDNLHICRFVQ